MAAYLSLSPDTIRRLRQAQAIPYVVVSPRRYRYRPEEIQRWLDERSVRERENGAGEGDVADEIMGKLREEVTA